MNTNNLRRLNWLWKNRHTHKGDTTQSQITVIKETIERVEEVAFAGVPGAYIHLTASTQSIGPSLTAVSWTARNLVHEPLNFNTPTFPATKVAVREPGYYNVALIAGWDSYTDGGSVVVRLHRAGGTFDMWPPLEDPGAWTSGLGDLFVDEAHAIECRTGDEIEILLGHEDASAVDLSTAHLTIYLVDTLRTRTPLPLLITSTIPNRGASPSGEIFFDETFEVAWNGELVVLSGSSDGSTQITVDNAIDVDVTHADGSTASTFTVFTDPVVPTGPHDISDMFEVGINQVQVVLRDQGGGDVGSSAIWLVRP